MRRWMGPTCVWFREGASEQGSGPGTPGHEFRSGKRNVTAAGPAVGDLGKKRPGRRTATETCKYGANSDEPRDTGLEATGALEEDKSMLRDLPSKVRSEAEAEVWP
jgi:hypothetical protein